ncbi:Uncharacterised protein [Streptococcus pneumoniae]|nr:Uncharacterised protein [Streptococcus pneumoniae]
MLGLNKIKLFLFQGHLNQANLGFPAAVLELTGQGTTLTITENHDIISHLWSSFFLGLLKDLVFRQVHFFRSQFFQLGLGFNDFVGLELGFTVEIFENLVTFT